MKSKVYFVSLSDSDTPAAIAVALKRLLDESRVLGFLKNGDRTAVKMHFGEEGNTGYVKSRYLREICARISAKAAIPTVADTNTLYRGKRMNSRDHTQLAREHGFTKEAVGAQDILAIDDRDKENTAVVRVDGKFIRDAKVCKFFLDADAIVDVSHFKGHIMTGFGGALKNIGMGCATREGKLAQHSDIAPIVILENCTGCGACVKSCPVKVITLKNKKSHIDKTGCIGCASCIAACKYNAIEVDWDAGGDTIQEKMVEYAGAILRNKRGRAAFINFALKITAECDCLAKDDPIICPDIGIFASNDPVAVDKACYDAIIKACGGKDVLKEIHPKRDGFKQLRYAAALSLGNLEYDLISI